MELPGCGGWLTPNVLLSWESLDRCLAGNLEQTDKALFLQVLTSCSLLPPTSPLLSLLGEQQPESQLEEAKGLLLAVGGEQGLFALIDVVNKKTVSNDAKKQRR